MRHRLVACVFGFACVTALAGCAQSDKKDSKSAGEEEWPAEYLGPIPTDFQSTLAAADLAQASWNESVGMDAFASGLALTDSKGGARAANGADPSLPNMNECETLHQLLAATLVPRDINGIDPTPNLALLRGYRCDAMAAAIGASLFDMPGAVAYAARQFRAFERRADRCATFDGVEPSGRAASAFVVAKNANGAYLAGYPDAGISGAFEGGGNASTLAIRAQASLRATTGTGRSLSHDVAIATLVDRGARSAHAQRLETIETRDESLTRDVNVTFSYGDDRSLHEETHFKRVTAGLGEQAWTLNVDAVPVAEDGAVNGLEMTMKLVGVSSDRSLTLPCDL